MRDLDNRLVTPIYLKARPDMPWPEGEKCFYVLSGSGLFLCRDTPFFRSCVPARAWPSELAGQQATLDLRYPLVPRPLFERVVGFFEHIARLHSAEAGVLLAWDRSLRRVRLLVPEQTATVSRSSWTGKAYPIGLFYETPAGLPANLVLFGDIHSHVDGPAYASHTDKEDETHRPGLHIVVGRIFQEPPEVHVEAVVDGTRFPVAPDQVLEGYQRRRPRLPSSWVARVKIDPPPPPAWSPRSTTSSGFFLGPASPRAGTRDRPPPRPDFGFRPDNPPGEAGPRPFPGDQA